MATIKGIRTDCDTKKVSVVDLEYYFTMIKFDEGPKEFIHLVGGPTGYESADARSLDEWAFKLRTRLNRKVSWAACFGSDTINAGPEPPSEDNGWHGEPAFYKAGYDKLEIPASELRRIFKERRQSERRKTNDDD